MTYDHDSKALVTVTLSDALEAWGGNVNSDHVIVINEALKDAQKAFERALKKGDRDAMLGASKRLEQYADRLHAHVNRLATHN